MARLSKPSKPRRGAFERLARRLHQIVFRILAALSLVGLCVWAYFHAMEGAARAIIDPGAAGAARMAPPQAPTTPTFR